jgi:hypothetical protein
MSELSSFVQVNLTTNTATIARQGFGVPLWLGYHTVFPERYRRYRSLSAMVSDGFTTRHPAYRAVAREFAQNPRPPEAVVGRLPAAHTHTQTLTITSAVAGQYIRCKVISPVTGAVTQIERLIPSSSSTTAEAAAVELLIEAVSGVASAAASAVITITPDTAGDVVYIYDLENCELKDTTADAGYDDELAALQLVDNSWYFITIDTCSQANVNLVAAWALANEKLYFVHTSAGDELTGAGTLGATLKAATNDRTVLLWAPNVHECGAEGFLAKGAPKAPGSITFAFKNIAGLTAKTLSDTSAGYLEADNINWYQTRAGRAITFPGKCAGGEWVDIVHGTDALKAAMAEDVYAILVNSDKVPYTDAGRDLLLGAVSGVLQRFENSGLLAAGWSVDAPSVDDQSDADKAARRFPNITFNARYAGAIHFAGIEGTLSF